MLQTIKFWFQNLFSKKQQIQEAIQHDLTIADDVTIQLLPSFVSQIKAQQQDRFTDGELSTGFIHGTVTGVYETGLELLTVYNVGNKAKKVSRIIFYDEIKHIYNHLHRTNL